MNSADWTVIDFSRWTSLWLFWVSWPSSTLCMFTCTVGVRRPREHQHDPWPLTSDLYNCFLVLIRFSLQNFTKQSIMERTLCLSSECVLQIVCVFNLCRTHQETSTLSFITCIIVRSSSEIMLVLTGYYTMQEKHLWKYWKDTGHSLPGHY